MNGIYGALHIDADDVDVFFHCDHDDERSSYRITSKGSTVTIYLAGTPEELGAFADAIVHAVSRRAVEVFEASFEQSARTKS